MCILKLYTSSPSGHRLCSTRQPLRHMMQANVLRTVSDQWLVLVNLQHTTLKCYPSILPLMR